MATNTLKTRIKHKIGTATEWQTAAENSQFKPLEGELIIYENATTPRLKVGDGSSLVTDLPFIDGIKVSVTGSGNAITAASYDENTRTLTLTKGASYTDNTGDITGVTAGKGLTGGATSGTATLNVGAGAGITVTDDAVGHTNNVTAGTASEGGSARTLAYGGSFNIPSVTYDAQGHITGKGSIALKLPAKPTYTDTNTTYDLAAAKSKANGSVTLDLTAGGSGSGTDSVTIKGTGATTVTTDANGVIIIDSTDTNTQTVTSVNSKTGDVSLTYSDVSAAPTSHASTGTTYGVASASEYGHAMASSTSPKANGTAAVGSETAKFARGDHVHPLQTTVSGNAGTATKLKTPVDITLTGDVSGTVSFDGSADVSITTTVADNSHNHSASNITGTLSASQIPNISIDKLVAGTTNTTIPSSLLPAYVDDVLEYTAKANFPTTGETGKIYVDKTTNLTYRWSGSAYVEISPSLALGSTSSTAHRGDHGAAAYAHAVTNKGIAKSSGLYKITTNSEGHVTAATAVAKADITALGIPGSDTTYSAAGSSLGLVKSGGDVTISNGVITVNDNSHNHTIANVDNLQTTLDGKADKNQGVFYIEGGGTTDTTNKVATWTGSHDDITAYYEGLAIIYKIGTAGSTTTTLNINNLGAVSVVKNATTAVSTTFPVNSVILLVYTLDETTAYWKAHDYDTNTKTTTGTSNKASTKLFLAGATSQASSATTYSNSKVYIGTDNCLYSNGAKVLTDYTDTNTTYTFATGSTNGTFTVTPSGGTAQSVAIKGLGSNAYTSTAYLPLAGGTVIGTTIFKGKDSTTGNNVNIYVQDYSGTNKLKITGADGKLCTGRIDTYGSGDNNFGFVTAIDGNSRGTIGISSNNELLFKAWNTAKVGSGDVPEVYKLPIPTATAKTTYNIWTTKEYALGFPESGKNYPVEKDSSNRLYVNVPWTDNNTVYTHPAGSGASKTSGLYKFSTDSTSHISGVTAVTKADITGLGIPGSDTNYYHTPSYTSTIGSTATGIASSGATNVKIATGTGVNDLYIPVATASTPGITLVYPAASCTTYTSDAGTCTPKAVKQSVELFAKDYCLPLTGGNISGHVYFTGSKASSSTGNTSQIVFGTSSDQHVAITSNDNALVINPSTTETSNATTGSSQIVLYLNKSSSFPKGITGNLTGTASRATADANGNNIANTYAKKPQTYTFTIPILAETDGVLGQYMEEITGLSTNDTVFADIDLSAVNTEDWEAMEQAWGNIGRISTSDGAIVVHPKAATNVPINVILKIFK